MFGAFVLSLPQPASRTAAAAAIAMAVRSTARLSQSVPVAAPTPARGCALK